MMGYQKVTPSNYRKETEQQQQQQPKTIEWHRDACNRNYTLCTTRFFLEDRRPQQKREDNFRSIIIPSQKPEQEKDQTNNTKKTKERKN